jgi:hypothetical protein
LAQVFRRPADHQAAQEHRHHGQHQQAVEPRADAAGGDLAEHHVEHRDAAALRCEAVVHRVDRTGRGQRRRGPEQRTGGLAETGLLALHGGAGEPDGAAGGGHLHPGQQRDGRGRQDHHGREYGAALAPVLHHQAERPRHRERDHQKQEDLEQIGERVRVLERMGPTDIPTAAGGQDEDLQDGRKWWHSPLATAIEQAEQAEQERQPGERGQGQRQIDEIGHDLRSRSAAASSGPSLTLP